jgi:hypothetical protein
MLNHSQLSEGFGRWVLYMEVTYEEAAMAQDGRRMAFDNALNDHRTPVQRSDTTATDDNRLSRTGTAPARMIGRALDLEERSGDDNLKTWLD